jgi:hypothetical protein
LYTNTSMCGKNTCTCAAQVLVDRHVRVQHNTDGHVLVQQRLLWARNLLAKNRLLLNRYILVKHKLLYGTGTSKCSTGCKGTGTSKCSTGCYRTDMSRGRLQKARQLQERHRILWEIKVQEAQHICRTDTSRYVLEQHWLL